MRKLRHPTEPELFLRLFERLLSLPWAHLQNFLQSRKFRLSGLYSACFPLVGSQARHTQQLSHLGLGEPQLVALGNQGFVVENEPC